MVYLSMDVDCGVGDAVGSEQGVLGVEERYVTPTFERMLPRFLDFAAENGIVLTFFLVAGTVDGPARRAMVRRIVEAGHEVASHSMTHPKAIGLLDDAALHTEVVDSKHRLEDAAGTEVVGFRAPGFYINDRVLDALIAAGYRYSSSVNSALGYNLAKIVVGMAANVFRRDGATSYHVEPGALVAPHHPYRPARGRFWRAGDGPPFCEIPVSTGFARTMPGVTFALDTMLPARLRQRFLERLVDRSKAANIVLHDFELLEDGDMDPHTALPRTTAMLWHHPRELKREQLVALARGGTRRFGLLRDLARASSN